jgi:hypothetical protein
MSGIVGSFFNHRGSGIVAKLGTDGHTFNSAGAGKKAITEAVVVVADGVDGTKLADDAVDSEHYTDGSIDNAHIADDAIDSEHYAAGSIDNAHLADDAVDSDELAAGAVDTAHIADNQVTLAKMAGGTDGNIISYDASGDPVAIATGSDGQVLTSTGAGSPPAFEAAGGGGPDEIDIWRLNGTLSGDQDPLTSNWERQDAESGAGAWEVIGTGMSQSSGVFTFPSTGKWYIQFFYRGNSVGNDTNWNHAKIEATNNDSTWAGAANTNFEADGSGSRGMNGTCMTGFDVSDVSNQKVRFGVDVTATNVQTNGSTDNLTSALFIRYGDT